MMRGIKRLLVSVGLSGVLLVGSFTPGMPQASAADTQFYPYGTPGNPPRKCVFWPSGIVGWMGYNYEYIPYWKLKLYASVANGYYPNRTAHHDFYTGFYNNAYNYSIGSFITGVGGSRYGWWYLNFPTSAPEPGIYKVWQPKISDTDLSGGINYAFIGFNANESTCNNGSPNW